MPALESVDDRLQQAMKRVLLASLPGLLTLFWLALPVLAVFFKASPTVLGTRAKRDVRELTWRSVQ